MSIPTFKIIVIRRSRASRQLQLGLLDTLLWKVLSFPHKVFLEFVANGWQFSFSVVRDVFLNEAGDCGGRGSYLDVSCPSCNL